MGNAVGGQMLEKTNLVKPANPTKVVELTLKFDADYNEEILKTNILMETQVFVTTVTGAISNVTTITA